MKNVLGATKMGFVPDIKSLFKILKWLFFNDEVIYCVSARTFMFIR